MSQHDSSLIRNCITNQASAQLAVPCPSPRLRVQGLALWRGERRDWAPSRWAWSQQTRLRRGRYRRFGVEGAPADWLGCSPKGRRTHTPDLLGWHAPSTLELEGWDGGRNPCVWDDWWSHPSPPVAVRFDRLPVAPATTLIRFLSSWVASESSTNHMDLLSRALGGRRQRARGSPCRKNVGGLWPHMPGTQGHLYHHQKSTHAPRLWAGMWAGGRAHACSRSEAGLGCSVETQRSTAGAGLSDGLRHAVADDPERSSAEAWSWGGLAASRLPVCLWCKFTAGSK